MSYQVFLPPSRHNVPPVAADTPPDDYAPAIFFKDHIPAGENVFVTTLGVVTEKQPQFWEQVQTVYWGGHIATLSAAEVTLLTAAGYGPYITTVSDPTIVTPPSGGGSTAGTYGSGNYNDGNYGG